MYEKLLRDLQHGVEFTTKASTTPNPAKLNTLLEYILSCTSKLPALCISIEKKVQSTLPRRGFFGFRSASDVLLHTTLPKIRECEFNINILRAIILKCKALGILCKINEVVIRIIDLLLQQSHEEYLKLFYHISLESFESKEAIDYSSLVTPIINLCNAEFSTSWAILDRQKHALHALSSLIKVCISQPGTLELSFDSIFGTIIEFLDTSSFYGQSPSIGSEDGSLAAVELSDLSMMCFDRLASAPSISSLIALLNTMISYFDHYGWSHGSIIVELFVRLDVVAFQHRHSLPTISLLIAHANYIATSELAENITRAERVNHPRHHRSNSGASNDLSQPSLIAASYIEAILQITTAVIEREAPLILESTKKDPSLAKLLTYSDTNKSFYYLTHILWMIIVWKSFQINSCGKSQAHDIILSTIEYKSSIPPLQLSSPFDSDEYSLDDMESNRNPMIDVLQQVWQSVLILSKHRFPRDSTKFEAIPFLFQVLQEKVQGLVTTPGVRLDLLIPAKNAMFIFVLHAISIVLSENVFSLTAITDDCMTTLTGDMTCELALLLRSRSWQTQRLSVTVLYQLFYAHKQQLTNQANELRTESMDAWAPYDDRLICVLRDGIFNALCTQYSHQAHSVAALFKLQQVMIDAFGEDELLAVIPMILALEEFWSIYSSIGPNDINSSSSATSTSTAMSSISPAAEPHERDDKEMLRCQRWYFLAFFFHVSRVYAISECQRYVMQQVLAWGKKNALSRYLALDSVNGVLIIDHTAADSASKQSVQDATIERVNRKELMQTLLQSAKLTKIIPPESIHDAFSATYRPQEDPFTKLQELHAEMNVSKSLFPDDHHSVDETYTHIKR